MICRKSFSQNGNIFFTLFGAVALMGVLGAGMMSFMKGPLATAVKVSRVSAAETQMTLAAQLSVMAAVNQAGSGDCDADTFVEPLPWRDAGALPKPTGGGLIPNDMAINKIDPWGTDYGYCVWDSGAAVNAAGCGGVAQLRLEGGPTDEFATIALISAGPDRTFQSTCADFADTAPADGDPDTPMLSKTAGSDDMHLQYTYAEATGAGGGLWKLKTGDPDVAVIGKDLEVTGGLEMSGVLNLTGQGLILPGDPGDDSVTGACGAANDAQLRRNTTAMTLELCDADAVPAAWTPVSGAGGATEAFDPDATCAAPADAGNVRYDAVTQQPQFCNGTAWQPFALGTPTASIILEPASNYTMNISGPCSGAECPYKYTAWVTFTVRNQGQTASAALSVPTITGANATSFEIDAGTSTCDDGPTLAVATAAGNSCVIKLRAKAQGNGSYSATLNVVAGTQSVSAPLYGIASSFGCSNGARGWGGIVVGNCTGAGGTEPGTGQIIIQEAGCGSSIFEPVCTGDPAGDVTYPGEGDTVIPDSATTAQGNQNTANLLGYPWNYESVMYCNGLVKDGYDDWFLPSDNEMSAFYADPIIRGMFGAYSYHTSNMQIGTSTSGILHAISMVNGGITYASTYVVYKTRCARRHNTPLPALQADTNTFDAGSVSGTVHYGYTTPGVVYTFPQNFKFYSFNVPMTVSIAGTGSPEFQIAGGAWQTADGTLNPGSDIVKVRATASAAAGEERSFTLTIGTKVTTFKLRTQDPALTYNMFVTSTTSGVNMGGISGADANCQSQAQAAGLAGWEYYKAYLGVSSMAAYERVPWKFGQILNMAGQTVFTNHAQFIYDTALPATVNRTAGNSVVTGFAWTGMLYTGGGVTSSTWTCSNWGTPTSGLYAFAGTVGASSSSLLQTPGSGGGGTSCTSTGLRHYCIGPDYDTGNPCEGVVKASYSKKVPGAYTVVVPPGCAVTFKLWGGAGGGYKHASTASGSDASGGGGGYAAYSETVGGSAKTYWYYVGGDGGSGLGSGAGPCVSNTAGGESLAGFAGGAGGLAPTSACNGGGGGATILRETDATGTILAIAGGGGGARATSGAGKAGGDTSSTYFAGQSAGGNGIDDTVGATHSPGGGGGYDGAGGGGGDTTASGALGMGGKNWVRTGAGIVSSTVAGSGATSGNNGDADKSSAGFSTAGNSGISASGSYDGAVIVKY